MKNKTLEQLKQQKQDIEEHIKLIEQEQLKQKWEPVGGDWDIYADGTFESCGSSEEYRLFSTERPTQEQAEKSRDKMRIFNRLLAYHDEFCADCEFIDGEKNYYIYEDCHEFEFKKYKYLFTCGNKSIGVIYFPKQIAIELVEKLNSGEVEL